MRQLCVLVIFTILAAGGVYCDPIREAVLNEGSSYTFSVVTFLHKVSICHLKTPHNDIISFAPGDESQTTEKYYIEQGIPEYTECTVVIRNIDKNDGGIWELSYDHDGEAGRMQQFNITVNAAEPEESPEPVDENVTLLTKINHFTRQELVIDISLNKESYEEECYVKPPSGVLTKADLLQIEKVKVQSSSNYVSCRITIGPMSEELLGEWWLCGNSTKDNMRCQPAIIEWNNNNAIANWESLVQPMFPHPVNLGGNVNPGVAGRGDVITCHVITPDGEDLVIKSDVKYPHIERIAPNSNSLCSIDFTDIDRPMIGNWAIYGKFRAATSGLNEVRLPLNFFLYNEANPYEQAYNVTTVQPEGRHLVTLGTSIDEEVSSSGNVDNCLVRLPSGQSFDLYSATKEGVAFKSSNSEPVCHLYIDPITEEMVGEWQLIGKFSNDNLFTEKQYTFHIIKEDPANPIIDEHREVENLTELIVDTHMGASHRVTINNTGFIIGESCHLLTPNGLQYAFIAGFNVPNVEIIEENGVECGVNVNVVDPNMLGEWTLIARATRLSVPIERRLSFTIRVEETISLENQINITEGADLYLRLPNETELHDTCKLYGPDGEEVTNFEVDPIYVSSCGYIIRSINHSQHGQWSIVYGNQIIYRATFEVNILGLAEVSIQNLVWTMGSSVNTTVGPEDALYCKLVDAMSYMMLDGFGPCKIVVDRVTSEHAGYWTIYVGLPGSVLVQQHRFYVDVHYADPGPVVTTNVTREAPSVLLTCSVPAEYDVQACKFRNPRGDIFVASHGVGQDGYIFHTTVNNGSESQSSGCTLRLASPTVQDLGLWRCGVVTDRDTYFGFLTVICPWLMQDSAVAASVVTEPVLTVYRNYIFAKANEPLQMSCSIDSAIRYCYFRDRNGTVYSVGPSTSSPDYEYVGNGFDAGDCGIRFSGLSMSSSGAWSCHVGVVEPTAPEQWASLYVSVTEWLYVDQYWSGTAVAVSGQAEASLPAEYCRFVRIDGFGFTTENAPPGYEVDHWLHSGRCMMYINNPNILDMHPWTVGIKLFGHDGEFTKSTIDTPIIFPPQQNNNNPGAGVTMGIFLWTMVAVFGFVLLGSGLALIPKKNREWTYARASRLRNSFRKQPLPFDVYVHDLPRKV